MNNKTVDAEMRIDMKKKQILTGVVERVDFPNRAVVKAQVPQPDESVATEYAIVKGALPGQTVEFSVKKARKINVKDDCALS